MARKPVIVELFDGNSANPAQELSPNVANIAEAQFESLGLPIGSHQTTVSNSRAFLGGFLKRR